MKPHYRLQARRNAVYPRVIEYRVWQITGPDSSKATAWYGSSAVAILAAGYLQTCYV